MILWCNRGKTSGVFKIEGLNQLPQIAALVLFNSESPLFPIPSSLFLNKRFMIKC